MYSFIYCTTYCIRATEECCWSCFTAGTGDREASEQLTTDNNNSNKNKEGRKGREGKGGRKEGRTERSR